MKNKLRSTSTTVERRTFAGEIRSVNDGMAFEGYAARFNERTYIGPPKQGFYEEIASSAFTQVIKDSDVRCLLNHAPDNLLGRTSSGTLRLSEDSTGLHVDDDLPDTSVGRDVSVLVKRRDLRGMSFSFEVGSDDWKVLPGGHAQLRTINVFSQLYDVGPVTFPAYESTTANVRMTARTGARVGGVESREGVIDMGLGPLLQAADAAIDAAIVALAAGNPAQACCLLTAASLSVMEASWALWWTDPSVLTMLGAGSAQDLLTSLDSAIDAAVSACAGGNVDPAPFVAAGSAVDAVLAVFHLMDADDMGTPVDPATPPATTDAGDTPTEDGSMDDMRRRWLDMGAAVLDIT